MGIIAEFNPFHNGHKYLLTEAKRIAGADYCIVVMSGDFVQRGGPAMTGKHTRAHMALLNGADLVLELPVCYATGSAGYFARGAVTLLEKIGVTDVLCFGSECGEIPPLMEAARVLSREDAGYQTRLKENLKQGLSFPAARLKALNQTATGMLSRHHGILTSPNDILGVEYCLSLLRLNSPITPLTISRQGAAYHDVRLAPENGGYSSASALRLALEKGDGVELIKQAVPENILPLLISPMLGPTLIREDDFSQLLRYKLLLEADTGYAKYGDMSEDLSDKITKNLFSFNGYRDLVHALKSRDLTFSRISRCLLHILLNIYQADMAAYREEGFIFYARMLGFRKEAGELLHKIKKHGTLPLLSKAADAPALLHGTGLRMFQQDIQAAHLYDVIYAAKYGQPPVHEYTRQLICR